jgi:hypothetical protein
MTMKARYERPTLDRAGSFKEQTGNGGRHRRDRYHRMRSY